MGINFEEVKAIIQLGIMGVISHTYITQQKRLFEQQEKVITVLAKLENQLNNDFPCKDGGARRRRVPVRYVSFAQKMVL